MSSLRLVPVSGQPIDVESEPSMVGRDPSCEIVVTDGSVSRRHARLERRGAAWWVVDQGSANGTYVNSQRIAEHALKSGQELRFGALAFRVELVEDPEATVATPILDDVSAATLMAEAPEELPPPPAPAAPRPAAPPPLPKASVPPVPPLPPPAAAPPPIRASAPPAQGAAPNGVVSAFHPTLLVGASGQPGAFSEAIIRDMRSGCPRPIVLALSNPTSKTEVTPEDFIRWTEGAGMIGTGSPFAPVEHRGITHTIGQGNNALIFPGVGLGATAVEARWLPDEAFTAAARALGEFTAGAPGATPAPGSPIYPSVLKLRAVARAVAIAVGLALVEAGAAPPLTRAEVERRVAAGIWEPEYLPYRAAATPPTPAPPAAELEARGAGR